MRQRSHCEGPLRNRIGSGDPDVALGARLLRSAAARLPSPDAGRRRRVWARLEERPGARARPLALSSALAGGLLVFMAAVASATVARGVVERLLGIEPAAARDGARSFPPSVGQAGTEGGTAPLVRAVATAAEPTTASDTAAGPAARTHAAAPAAGSNRTAAIGSSPRGPGGGAPRRDAPVALRPRHDPVTAQIAGPAAAPSPPSRTPLDEDDAAVMAHDAAEAELVSQAQGALDRRNPARDPARALRLIDEYLARYPEGSVPEEALVTGIEAATELGSARAGELAGRYLRQFPGGRHTAFARWAVARAAPR